MISQTLWDSLDEHSKRDIQAKYDKACDVMEEYAFDEEDSERIDQAKKLKKELEYQFGNFLEKRMKRIFVTTDAGYVTSARRFDGERSIAFPEKAHDELIIKKAEATLMIESTIRYHYGGLVTDLEINSHIPIYAVKCDHRGNKWVEILQGPITDRMLLFRSKDEANAFLSYPENQEMLDWYFIIKR